MEFNAYTKLAETLAQSIGLMADSYAHRASEGGKARTAVERESWGYNFNAMCAEIAADWAKYLRGELAGSHAPQSLEGIACELLHSYDSAVSEMLSNPHREEFRAKVTVLHRFAELVAGRNHRCDFTALATQAARRELESCARNPNATRFAAVRDELVRLGADSARIDGDYAVLVEEAEQRRKDDAKRQRAAERREAKRAAKEA